MPYANICDTCDNDTPAEFEPAQLNDVHALKSDAHGARTGEVERHGHVASAL